MATYGQRAVFNSYFSGGALKVIHVYHYDPGTLNTKNVWTDRAKTTTAAQPVVSDANGVASFFCDGLYDMVVKDAAGNTLKTYTDYSIVDQTTSTGEGAALTSASTLTLGTDGDWFHVTGSTPITALSGTQTETRLVFDANPPLTHSGNLILQNASNYTPAVGDVMTFANEGSGVWREVSRNTDAIGAMPNTPGLKGQTLRYDGSSYYASGAQAGYLHGLTLSNNGSDATNDIDVAVGEASNTATAYASRLVMTLASALTKRLDAAWVTGTNQGGLASSLVAGLTNTTYHVFLIRVAGVDDIGFDTSATAANLVADHAATHYRRVGSIVRSGGAIKAFVQDGDVFQWLAPVNDATANNPGTSAVTLGLTVPTGLNVTWVGMAGIVNVNSTETALLVTDLATTDTAPTTSLNHAVVGNIAGNQRQTTQMQVRTNTSGQIRHRISASSANTTVILNTTGWIDRRGRDN